jgi:hypothetical protein
MVEAVSSRQRWILSWAVLGVSLLLLRAIVSLTPVALEPIRDGSLNRWHWVILILWIVFNAYAEGYRGFHKSFSPRVARRGLELGRNPRFWEVLLAAPISMGLIRAPRRTMIVAWSVLIGIVILVVSVRSLPQPWRGIVDAGVVVGLALGWLSLLIWYIRGMKIGTGPIFK